MAKGRMRARPRLPAGLSALQRAVFLGRLFPVSDALREVTVTVQEFDRIWDGLLSLSKKTLPSPESEMRVGLLLKAYEPHHEAIKAARQKVEDQHAVKAGAKISYRDPYGYAQKLKRIRDTRLTLRLPRTLLKKSDLPVVSDGEDDVKNRQATAAIRTLLGPLFEWETTDEVKQLLAEPAGGAFSALEAIGDEPVDESVREIGPAPDAVEPPPEAAAAMPEPAAPSE